MTKNQIEYMRLLEEQRHNIQTEEVAKGELRNKSEVLGETVRHNTVSEVLSARDIGVKESNLYENIRHNTANEALTASGQYIDLSKVAETQRHNEVTERQGLASTITRGASDIGNFFNRLVPVIKILGG